MVSSATRYLSLHLPHLALETGATVTLSLDGWDTHANQGGAEGQLANRLANLDATVDGLVQGLGPEWSNTAVIICTEFGRTARINGTRGTDHGTASTAIVLGGGECITFDPTFTPYGPNALKQQLNEHNVSWNAGLNYKTDGGTLLYVRVSKGYKEGSFPTASVATM